MKSELLMIGSLCFLLAGFALLGFAVCRSMRYTAPARPRQVFVLFAQYHDRSAVFFLDAFVDRHDGMRELRAYETMDTSKQYQLVRVFVKGPQ